MPVVGGIGILGTLFPAGSLPIVDPQGTKIPNLADPTLAQDAATKAYVDLDKTSYLRTDGTRALTGDQSAGTHKITNLGTPSAAADAATKAYVDAIAQGLETKGNAIVLYSANVAALTGAPGTTDGVTPTIGDTVLLNGQTVASQNGLWVTGTPWVRPTDFATGSHAAGAFVFVLEGTNFGDTGWVCSTNPPTDIVDTNSLTFVQFSSAGVVTAGNGLTKVGNQISAVAADTSVNVGVGGIACTGLIVQTGSAAERGFIDYQASSDANGSRFIGKKSRGTAGSPTAHSALDVLADFAAEGYDGSVFFEAGYLRFVGDQAGGTGKRTRIEVWCHDGNALRRVSTTLLSTITTTDATQTVAMSIPIPASTLHTFGIRWHGRRGSNNDELFRQTAIEVRRKGSAAPAQWGVNNDVTPQKSDDPTWVADFLVNTGSNSTDIRVQGASSATIIWDLEVTWREL